MSNKVQSSWGAGVSVALLGALSSVAACGNDFESDCMSTRTCPVTNEGGSGGESEGGGTVADGGSAMLPEQGGAGPSDGGAGPDSGCKSAKDCDNGIPEDGAEVCEADGQCTPGNVPPTIVDVSPADEAGEVEPDAAIVITFSETLAADSVAAGSVQILDGETPVEGELAYANSKVTFTPKDPLALLTAYEVSVTTAITDAEGAALLEPHRSTFTIRDGAWKTVDVAESTSLGRLVDRLPLSSSGQALVTWSGASCSPDVRTFLRGAPLGAAESPAANESHGCSGLAAAGNQSGVNAVSWFASATFVGQYRDGAWGGVGDQVSLLTGTEHHSRLAVQADGAVTFFQSFSAGMTVWQSDSTGDWSTSDAVSTTLIQLSPPEVAFDARGNGLAVWRADDDGQQRIVSSRLLASSGRWGQAAAVTGGASAGPADFGRGAAPAIAMDDDGNAVVLWVNCSSQFECVLRASHFSSADDTWAAPVDVTSLGSLVVEPSNDPPGLVFDGTTFVGAFTATSTDAKRSAYTLRYDRVAEGWDLEGKRQSVADAQSAGRMPRLVGNGRGHLLLAWVTGTSPSFKLVYQRFAADAWSATQTLAGGALTSKNLESGFDYTPPPALPVSMNAAGMAAIAWGSYAANGITLQKIRLATFD